MRDARVLAANTETYARAKAESRKQQRHAWKLRPQKIERALIEPQPVVHADEESECIRGVIRGPNALTIVLDLSKLVA